MGKRETSRGFSVSQLTSTTISNTTNETVLFSQVIPGGTMGTVKKCIGTILCTLTTPTLNLPSITIRLKLGNSVMLVASNIGLPFSQTNTPFLINFSIRNRDNNSSQIVYANINYSADTLPLLIDRSKGAFAIWNVDTSISQTLTVTAQFGSLSLGTSLTTQDADIDLT